MGLDVYLYYSPNLEDTRRRTAEYDVRSDAIYKEVFGDRKYEEVPEEARNIAHERSKVVAEELGLSEYGEPTDAMQQRIDLPSTQHPDHYWKIGYCRSSYNSSGFDRVVGNLINKDLDFIFDPPEEEYEFAPDWFNAKHRAEVMRDELLRAIKDNPYAVVSLDTIFATKSEVRSEEAALKAFIAERERHTEFQKKFGSDGLSGGNYSNALGDFFLGDPPLKFRAFIVGKDRVGLPVIYGIYEADHELTWYVEALDVCIEMCEWVLAKPKKEWGKYVLHWSG